MNLDTVLDTFGRSIEIVTKRIEKRRIVPVNRHPLADTREEIGIYLIGEPNFEAVLPELQQIFISPEGNNVMAYNKPLYYELYDRLNANQRRGIEANVIDILRPFKEYSYSMYPETLYQTSLNIFKDATNEHCATYFYKPTPEMAANAKNIILEDEKVNAYARGRYFKEYTCDILSKDIVIKTASYLKCYVTDFAIMLDCALLESGSDLLELQKLHNIKLIDEHMEMSLSAYIGSDKYVKQLLSRVCIEAQPIILPKEIDNPRVRKYITRAMELGFIIRRDNNGLRWANEKRGGLAQLGYFIQQVFCPKNVEQIPEKLIDKLFGVNRIGSAITQLQNAKKPQKWKMGIDSDIFYD